MSSTESLENQGFPAGFLVEIILPDSDIKQVLGRLSQAFECVRYNHLLRVQEWPVEAPMCFIRAAYWNDPDRPVKAFLRRDPEYDEWTAEPPSNTLADGWTERYVNGRRLFGCLSPLVSLKPGFEFRRFQFAWSAGAFNRVFSVSRENCMDAVQGEPTLDTVPGARPLSSCLEGDGSPLSYFAVCMMLSELGEVEAYWHGIDYRRGVFITAPPDLSPFKIPVQSPRKSWRSALYKWLGRATPAALAYRPWKFYAKLPRCWRPKVRQSESETNVVLYAYKREYGERLLRFQYRFGEGYSPEESVQEIGRGPRSIIT